jgi:indole-3-glycerol phosphate synthase
MKPLFIAEIKTQSMFGFQSKYPWITLVDAALTHGDWISVHTDPRFGGSFDDIHLFRRETEKPILAKGFHTHNDDVEKAFDLGADYVLIVDRFPLSLIEKYPQKILFEVSNLDFLSDLPSFDYLAELKFVYNGRDLKTGLGKKSIADYVKYREQFKWVCGASLIRTHANIEQFYPKCDAFIVGSDLVDFCKTL